MTMPITGKREQWRWLSFNSWRRGGSGKVYLGDIVVVKEDGGLTLIKDREFAKKGEGEVTGIKHRVLKLLQ